MKHVTVLNTLALSSIDIGILLPNNQRQHRTLQIQKEVLPYALGSLTVPRVSRSREHFPDGFNLQLLPVLNTHRERAGEGRDFLRRDLQSSRPYNDQRAVAPRGQPETLNVYAIER